MKRDRKRLLLHAATALSLANLLHIGVWSDLLAPRPRDFYFFKAPGHWFNVLLVIPSVVLLGLILGLLGFWAQRTRSRGVKWVARAGFLSALALVANGIRHLVPQLAAARIGERIGLVGLVTFGAIVLGAVTLFHGRITQHALRLCLLTLPLFPLLSLRAAHLTLSYQRGSVELYEDRPAAPFLAAPRTTIPRILFLVFDSFDQTEAFTRRPKDLDLPALDRLAASAIVFNSAYPPADSTWASIPSLLTGRHVTSVGWIAPNDLALGIDGAPANERWSELDNLFRAARRRGVNSAIVGWAHPYCRVLGSDVSDCQWFSYVPPPGGTLDRAAAVQASSLLGIIPGLARFEATRGLRRRGIYTNTKAWHLRQYRSIHTEVSRLCTDERVGLIFAHYPVPHVPCIYDRRRKAFAVSGESTYDDNLALVDRTLAELRERLEASQLWEPSVVVVTADHWQRQGPGDKGPQIGHEEHRIPLLIKLPHQTGAVIFPGTIQTHALYPFLLRVLSGAIPDEETALVHLHSLDWRSHGQ
jgi:hypothetical protein